MTAVKQDYWVKEVKPKNSFLDSLIEQYDSAISLYKRNVELKDSLITKQAITISKLKNKLKKKDEKK